MAKKILVVDDDPDFCEATETLLSAKGYDVVCAGDGKEAFELAKKEKPDLILLDVMMPQSDGFDIARQLKQEATTAKIPVIIITGIRKEMNLAFHFEPDEEWLPVKKVLEKPIKPKILLENVEEIIGQP